MLTDSIVASEKGITSQPLSMEGTAMLDQVAKTVSFVNDIRTRSPHIETGKPVTLGSLHTAPLPLGTSGRHEDSGISTKILVAENFRERKRHLITFIKE